MSYSLRNDIESLTKVDSNILTKIIELSELSISQCVFEDLLQDNSITSVDIGIGTLYINSSDLECVRYKFIPSEALDKSVKDLVRSNIPPLKAKVDAAVGNKINLIYKDLF